MIRSAKAHWEGSGKEGKGHLTSDSEVLNGTPYSFRTRFEDEKGTNPEELVAAALAGCFTMKLSFDLGAAGYTPSAIDTKAGVKLENGSIDHITLHLQATVPGCTKEEFETIAQKSKAECPISKLYKAEVTLEAHLV
jgi:osmotically inducible protein OsmC